MCKSKEQIKSDKQHFTLGTRKQNYFLKDIAASPCASLAGMDKEGNCWKLFAVLEMWWLGNLFGY